MKYPKLKIKIDDINSNILNSENIFTEQVRYTQMKN